MSYPKLIALLMDRGLRADVLKTLPPGVLTRSGLADLTREYSLSEIAVVTRAGPARMLGLANKGHLGPGADADLTIYAPDDDKARMFALPKFVIKAGAVVVEDGELRSTADGRTLHVEPEYDSAAARRLESLVRPRGVVPALELRRGISTRSPIPSPVRPGEGVRHDLRGQRRRDRGHVFAEMRLPDDGSAGRTSTAGSAHWAEIAGRTMSRATRRVLLGATPRRRSSGVLIARTKRPTAGPA